MPAYKKIVSRFGTVSCVLLLTLLLTIVINFSKVQAAQAASLSLSPNVASVRADEDLIIKVHINTAGEAVNVVQADVSYPTNLFDPAKSKVSCSSSFPLQAESTVNSSIKTDGIKKRLIKAACGISVSSSTAIVPFSGETDVATIVLHARPNIPSLRGPQMLQIVVDKDLTDGRNDYSAIARASDSANILATVTSADITVNSKHNSFSQVDLNNDKMVDMNDISMLVKSFGQKNKGTNLNKADLNSNHVIDIEDLSILLSNQL